MNTSTTQDARCLKNSPLYEYMVSLEEYLFILVESELNINITSSAVTVNVPLDCIFVSSDSSSSSSFFSVCDCGSPLSRVIIVVVVAVFVVAAVVVDCCSSFNAGSGYKNNGAVVIDKRDSYKNYI
uniref:Transmembrane protein n=1 Tax=Glossina austeni TaxID=7395 RepID=A0A1A9V6J3_GLOAU